jgi:predicted DNA-binding transcriptional regulator AlpA
MRFVSFDDLEAKGIKYTKASIHRLTKEKKFPQPVKGLGPENVWTEDVIDQYVESQIAAARGQLETT